MPSTTVCAAWRKRRASNRPMRWLSRTIKSCGRSSNASGNSKRISLNGISTWSCLRQRCGSSARRCRCSSSVPQEAPLAIAHAGALLRAGVSRKMCAKRKNMMGQTPQQVIDGQRQDWNRVAGGWEKWDRFFDEQMAFLNHRLVADARLRAGMHTLDLGSGTGYPALLGAQTVGPSGSMTGLDLAEQMLAVARRKATALKLANVTFRTGDVTALPFETASFDAVTSRFCLMFLPDIPKAAAEIARVLKPGGWIAAAVWSAPDKNPSIGLSMEAIRKVVELPPPDPTAPGIFRLAQPGDLAGMLQQAGLADVTDQEFFAEWSYASAEEYYTSLMEIAAPVQNLMAKLLDTQKQEVKRLITQAATQYRRGNCITFPIAVRMVAARKPL
ncbi:MAG: methyltransferase domain-containing protein [Nitrospira sp.]|nr:MAG: methyltransferase domain-containing protein [Nitrospira sp.]